MAQIDTRHAERDFLMQALIATHNNDFNTLIAVMEARMEKEDVEEVRQKFEQWKAAKSP